MRILPLLVVLAGGLAAAEAPLPPGAKPVNLGSVGADEGPAWHPDGYLYFTGHEGILRRNASGKTEVFRAGGGPNGLLFDAQGRLLVCEATGRRVIRIEADGKVTVLAERYEGHRFNSPNDLTVDSKGRIYFTDPRYGKRDDMEMGVEAVYRIDAPGKITRLTNRELERPNGIFATPGDQYLYVADNNNNNVGGARKLYRFRLKPDGTLDLASRKLIFDWQNGRGPDGLKLDREGRIWVAGGVTRSNRYESADRFKGGVYVLSPEGKLLEFIAVPVDEVTNCAFGGPGYHTLFITAGGTLWSIPTSTEGLVPFHGAPAR
ncbi:MAG TPA: SMP-30/gluconolactonase/LRE family protein [Bryobacteraceae bacterium]|nr:SMP-30/gluconolactonase/LRE family protein [Bryobacteraceae bacterium]